MLDFKANLSVCTEVFDNSFGRPNTMKLENSAYAKN